MAISGALGFFSRRLIVLEFGIVRREYLFILFNEEAILIIMLLTQHFLNKI